MRYVFHHRLHRFSQMENNKIITPRKSALIRVSSIHRRLHRFPQMEKIKLLLRVNPRESAFQKKNNLCNLW